MNKQRLVTGVILFLSLVAFGAAIALSQVVVTKLDALRESSHDNILWSLQRLELEAANLDASAKDASQTGEFAEFQQSFDIFASRVATFNEGPQFAPCASGTVFKPHWGNCWILSAEPFLWWMTPIRTQSGSLQSFKMTCRYGNSPMI